MSSAWAAAWGSSWGGVWGDIGVPDGPGLPLPVLSRAYLAAPASGRSRVDVLNAAWSHLSGVTPIRDPNEDSAAARAFAAIWTVARQAVLREGQWNFAMRRLQLQAAAGVDRPETYPFEQGYRLPPDMLRFVEILDERVTTCGYQIEGQYLLANSGGPVRIRYVVDVEEVAEWDASAVDALALRLAHDACEPLQSDPERRDRLWGRYQDTLKGARLRDARENPATARNEGTWIRAHTGYFHPGYDLNWTHQ
ncbi:hypothetical protein ACSMXM_01335 [Pacificimonas sp. ICDLI1SI03]